MQKIFVILFCGCRGVHLVDIFTRADGCRKERIFFSALVTMRGATWQLDVHCSAKSKLQMVFVQFPRLDELLSRIELGTNSGYSKYIRG